MNPFFTSPNSIQLQQKRVDAQLKHLTRRISCLPEGSATAYYVGNRKRMVGRINGKRMFFSEKDLPLVQDLILKKYLTYKCDELTEARKLLDHYFRFEQKHLGKAEQYLMANPLRAELLKNVFYSEQNPALTISLEQWMSAPDRHAAPYQEERTEETLFGLFVRSKALVLTFETKEHKLSFPQIRAAIETVL